MPLQNKEYAPIGNIIVLKNYYNFIHYEIIEVLKIILVI